jgi:ABC-type tungstate transport system permease subunit
LLLHNVNGTIGPFWSAAAALFRQGWHQVKVVAVGSGQALDIGRRGDADVVFVHDP